MGLSLLNRQSDEMLIHTTPSAEIVVDATALDTGHKARGIGRYAGALWRCLAEQDPSLISLRLTDAERAWQARLPRRHLPRFISSQRLLAAELRQAGCKVFGATEPWTFPRPGRGLQVVPTCHDVIPLEFPGRYRGWDNAKWGVYFRWLRTTRLLDRVAAIISPSEATKSALVHYLDVSPAQIAVIPHGLEHDRFEPPSVGEVTAMRRRLAIGSEPYLLYVGGFDYRKNVPRVVEGFAASGLSEDAVLVLAGPASASERGALFDVAERVGVARRVAWMGRVSDDDLQLLYGGAQALVYPSLSEGFGLQLLEAMACGCPVITSDCSALPEVAGGAGLLVDPHDMDSIADAVRRVFDTDESERLRSAGLDRAAQFSWAETARKTLDLYRSVL